MDPIYELTSILRERLRIIGDHAWRDRDSNGHMKALRDVSERLTAQHDALRDSVPPKLNHYLERCSYDKALAFLEQSDPERPGSSLPNGS